VFRSPGVQATRCQTATTAKTTAITARAMVLAVRMRLPVVLGWVGGRDQQLFRDPARQVGPSSRFGRYIGQPLLAGAAPGYSGLDLAAPSSVLPGSRDCLRLRVNVLADFTAGRISTLEWLGPQPRDRVGGGIRRRSHLGPTRGPDRNPAGRRRSRHPGHLQTPLRHRPRNPHPTRRRPFPTRRVTLNGDNHPSSRTKPRRFRAGRLPDRAAIGHTSEPTAERIAAGSSTQSVSWNVRLRRPCGDVRGAAGWASREQARDRRRAPRRPASARDRWLPVQRRARRHLTDRRSI
jgi:hypothetical protein